MMVAFRYDNDAVGTLYYSREVPSLFRGLRLSKLFGREGVITFESNGLFVLARGKGWPSLQFPGFRDIRGYRAMYRDFAASAATGRAPEMSLERALEDQRPDGSDLRVGRRFARRHARPVRPADAMGDSRYDVVIIGSGAGGGTMAHALADSGARILVLERGDYVPREPENWDPAAVWQQLRYRSPERWVDTRRRRVPAVYPLLRRREHEVLGLRALPAAPGGFRRTGPPRRRLAGLADRLRHAGAVLRPGRTPVRGSWPARRRSHRAAARAVSASAGPACAAHGAPGGAVARPGAASVAAAAGTARPGEEGGCQLCDTCNSFPCRQGAKSDAEVCCVRPALAHAAVELWTGASGPPADRQPGRDPRRSGGGRARRHGGAGRRRARRGGVRRGQLGGPAAAVRVRPAPGAAWPIPRGWSAVATWPISPR